MITVLKVQLPLTKISLLFVRNAKGTFHQFIDMDKEKELVNKLLKDKKESDLVCYCKCKVENDKIVDIKFMGEACAISTSATSVMIKLLIGKTLDEVRMLYKEYSDMIENGTIYDNLEEANAYGQIYKQQNRKHCAMLPWLGIIKALEQKT